MPRYLNLTGWRRMGLGGPLPQRVQLGVTLGARTISTWHERLFISTGTGTGTETGTGTGAGTGMVLPAAKSLELLSFSFELLILEHLIRIH